MKTTKFFLIVALLPLLTAVFSQSPRTSPKHAERISIQSAMQNPGLCRAMDQQLTREEVLGHNEAYLYYGHVKYNGIHWVIYGTYNEWVMFFNISIEYPPPQR